jgi:hypothetical protein
MPENKQGRAIGVDEMTDIKSAKMGGELRLDLSADVPLDAFVRRLSRMVEHMFGRDGEITPAWFAVTRAGEGHVIVTPVTSNRDTDPFGDRAKEQIAEKIRQHFKEHDVVRFAHVAEAWMVFHDEETHKEFARGNITITRPSLDPDRKEVVIIHAEDRSGGIGGAREIIRSQGRKPYLGSLEWHDSGPASIGRYASLLPPVTLN